MFSRYFSSYTGKNSKKKWDKEISLIVPDKRETDVFTLKVPKKLLMEHSRVFGGMPQPELKKCKKIVLEDVTVTALQKSVEFMQTSSVTFLNHSEVLETLRAAQKYEIETMVTICVDNLITVLEPSNVCEIYETAKSLSLSFLEYSCLKIIDRHAKEVLESRGFSNLRKPTVLDIIKRGSLNVNTEMVVFQNVLGWGLNNYLRHGGDPSDIEKFSPTIRYLLNYVRFMAMSEEELKDPEVDKYYRLMYSNELLIKDRSMSTTSQSSSGSIELQNKSRQYVPHYVHPLGVFEFNRHTIKSGEIFCLNAEVLKGRVFLTGVKLAFKPFAPTKSAACLYVVLTATNTSTTEHRTTRGTFLNTTDEASLELANPLAANESDRIQIVVSVKRAENICTFCVRKDVQIAMPESKAVALKITPFMPSSESEETGRCIFREIEYFY